MLLNVLANNTTGFSFYFEGSKPFLPFFSIFIYKCNAYNNYNVNKDVYFKVCILALHSNAILLFTSGEDVENKEKNERRTNNIR